MAPAQTECVSRDDLKEEAAVSAPTWLSADPHAARVRWRMIVVLCLFGLGMCAVVGRVYHLQVIEQQELLDRQSPVDRSITYTPRRGSVLDRNGVELAVSVKAPSIQARPRLIEDREAAARALAPILSMPYDKVHERLNPKRGFAWLRRQVHPSMAEAVRDLEMRGVEVTEEYKRYYPQQKLAGQIVGFVGIDGNGLEGVESALDRTLAGDATKILAKRDARGKVMLTGETPRFERFEGHSIELTIDEQIQRVAERALAEQVEAYEAKGGYAVAIDVQTGEVLAMANTPSFDPNRFGEFTSSDWRLRSITDTFEPGSVVKPLVLAAAIEEKTVSLTTPFDCEGGRIKIGRYTIRDSHAHDTLSAAEVVQVSSNICAYKIAQTIGRDKLHQYLRDFGFGSRPGLQLRGEQPGLVWPAERWAEVSFANVAFGQGFTATPIQVVNATAAIANGGMLSCSQGSCAACWTWTGTSSPRPIQSLCAASSRRRAPRTPRAPWRSSRAAAAPRRRRPWRTTRWRARRARPRRSTRRRVATIRTCGWRALWAFCRPRNHASRSA